MIHMWFILWYSCARWGWLRDITITDDPWKYTEHTYHNNVEMYCKIIGFYISQCMGGHWWNIFYVGVFFIDSKLRICRHIQQESHILHEPPERILQKWWRIFNLVVNTQWISQSGDKQYPDGTKYYERT